MKPIELQAILPLIVLSIGVVVLMLQIAFRRNAYWSWSISVLALLTTGVACLAAHDYGQVTALLQVDRYSQWFSLVFTGTALVVVLLSKQYLTESGEDTEEYYLLLLLATLGSIVLAHASHLASLLLGMELLGVALYTMIAYPDSGKLPLEAAVKYLVLSGAASALLLFGFALLYAATGSMDFATIGGRLASEPSNTASLLLVAAGVLIFSGLAFKLSVVPFHLWTPDVYQGAPAPVSGFLATVSKAAVFVALLRWYLAAGFYNYPALVSGLTALAVASMLAGNLLALQQQNTKRMLAYSSIAHMGYLLIILIACGHNGDPSMLVEAAAFYLLAYIASTLAAFALIGLISNSADTSDRDQIADLKGLFWRHPVLALLLTLAMLSLAGIPLTAGFIGKFYLFNVAIDSGLRVPIAALVLGSGLGIFYYLRIVYTMSTPSPGEHESIVNRNLSVDRLAVYALIYVILYLGVFPQTLMAYFATLY